MPTQFEIGAGECPIIDYFIQNNNKISWVAKISKDLRKNISGILRQVKSLETKGILKRTDCPDELINKLKKEREKGGSLPSDCYYLDYDMPPEWFVEIARPHLDNDNNEIRLKFMKSGMTSRMIRYEKFIDWIIKNRIGFNLEKEKETLPFIFNSFPSTLRWVLYSDLSAVQKMEQKTELQKGIFLSFLNNKIIEDLLNGAYLHHEDLAQMIYSFATRFEFYDLKPPEGEKGEMILGHGEITGGFGVTFKKIPEITIYKKTDKKRK